MGCAAFCGCALVAAVARLAGHEMGGGFYLVKYAFALTIGAVQVAHQRRLASARSRALA